MTLQVNSDKIYWQKNVDGTFSQIYSEKQTVGHFISTKAVDSEERSDITHLYKYPEGTNQSAEDQKKNFKNSYQTSFNPLGAYVC